jgi:N-acyl-D-aspartate/D-glutamate deacylase
MSLFLVTLGLLLAQTNGTQSPVVADVVIRNATLYDGSSEPGRRGDIAISRARIVGVGSFTLKGQARVIDGTGLIVAPGFIDLHTHSDYPLQAPLTRNNRNYLTQGVTTVVTGNCGSGPSDVAAYFAKLERAGIGTNVIHQAPHNDIRAKAMGNVNRPPTAAELKTMESLVDKAMRDGAWSLSTGLIYNPGTYSKTDELIALAKVAARHGGFYASHIRDEGLGLMTSIDEILKIGKEAQLPVHISHIKASGRKTWGKAPEAIALIEKARAGGQAVTADQYPYIASSTSLAATVIPTQFREGTPVEYQARLANKEQRARIRSAVEQALDGRAGGKSIQIARYMPNQAWQGRNLEQISDLTGKPPADIVLDIEQHGGAAIVNFGMNEEDVRLYMKQPWVATASDGSAMSPGDTVPHPRSYGCFPRKVGHYAIAEKQIPLEQAIRSCTGLPADILHLTDRGYLKPGNVADLVVLDPKTFADKATYDKPHQYSTGVKYLFVNGQPVINNGVYEGKLAGKVLRHKSAKP